MCWEIWAQKRNGIYRLYLLMLKSACFEVSVSTSLAACRQHNLGLEIAFSVQKVWDYKQQVGEDLEFLREWFSTMERKLNERILNRNTVFCDKYLLYHMNHRAWKKKQNTTLAAIIIIKIAEFHTNITSSSIWHNMWATIFNSWKWCEEMSEQ